MFSLRLGLIFGGRSGEHEVSVRSAKAVWEASLKAGYSVVGLGTTREGQSVFLGDCTAFFGAGFCEVRGHMGPRCFILPDPTRPGVYVERKEGEALQGKARGKGPDVPGGASEPGNGDSHSGATDSDAPASITALRRVPVDVFFPVLHGSFGEDGVVQGLLEMSGVPYVGAPVLGSAVCMDKDTTKRILATHGIPHIPALPVDRFAWQADRVRVLSGLSGCLEFPVFVKPSASGSSLGVTRVKSHEDLGDALDVAFLYDTKALIESSQEGLLEIECSVMGNEKPEASLPGQILPRREFYDYEAKYVEDTTELVIPAPIDEELTQKVQQVAVRAFVATGCRGLARVDFFVDTDEREAYVSEINTLPGFTAISMYPKLWEASGLPFHLLVKSLVDMAISHKASAWKEVRVRK